MQYKSKKSLDMFLVSFEACEEIKKVHEMQSLSKFWAHPELLRYYVKCAGKHKTIDCLNTETEQPKCVNCGEAHPANYDSQTWKTAKRCNIVQTNFTPSDFI